MKLSVKLSNPPVSKVVKPIEVSPSKKIRIDLKESKPKVSTLSKDKMHGKPAWVCHFCGKSGHIHPIVTSCKLLREQISQKCQCLMYKIL